MELQGIDISSHNRDIDYEKIKEAVDFAMVRTSYGFFNEDSMYEAHLSGLMAAQIPYGLYHYSYATNLEQAAEEVNGFLNIAKNYKPEYPLAIDMEYDEWKVQNGNPTPETLIDICAYFCEKLEEAGYYAIIYSNLNYFQTVLNGPKLDQYDKWLAEWSSEPTYQKKFGMWQYTSNGEITGINGRDDRDIAYLDYPNLIRGSGLNHLGEESVISPSENYKVGDMVHYHEIYTSSTSTKALKPTYSTGIITKIIPRTPNPYLIGNGTGWINDTSIDYKINQIEYVVQPGDTLSAIALKYGTTYQALAKKNGIPNPDLIYPGQRIII